METLGMDAPENLEEFIELVGAFANKDPDRNGLHDTIGYNVNNRAALGKWLILGIPPSVIFIPGSKPNRVLFRLI